MPVVSQSQATERLVRGVERVRPEDLPEIYSELFPESPPPSSLLASELVRLIRGGLKPEEIVDLWNVVFPEDRKVWYNEEEDMIHFNENLVGYTD